MFGWGAGGAMTGAGGATGGGGKAPGDMVSGMRPPLPIDPGTSCPKAVSAAATRVITKTRVSRGGRMPFI